ncbi:MAG TPA: hypothetical protein VGK06_11875 [Methanosarcina sp.]|jgi:hypothetical protein
MAKNSTTSNSSKAGTACGKSHAKAPADKPSKKDVKPPKAGKKEK